MKIRALLERPPPSFSQVDDDAFTDHVRDRLAGLPQVLAVTLGGSRAQGTHRPDSDWDFAIYYRNAFDPQDLRDIGNYAPRGQVTECAGLIGQAAAQAAHAVLAARGQWVTNDKRLLNLAGLRQLDEFVAQGALDPGLLGSAVEQALALCRRVLAETGPAPATA